MMIHQIKLYGRRAFLYSVISVLATIPFIFRYTRKRFEIKVPIDNGNIGGQTTTVINGVPFKIEIPEMKVETEEDVLDLKKSIYRQFIENPDFQKAIDIEFEKGKEETKARNAHLFEEEYRRRLNEIEAKSIKDGYTDEKKAYLIDQAKKDVENQKTEVFKIIDESQAPNVRSLPDEFPNVLSI